MRTVCKRLPGITQWAVGGNAGLKKVGTKQKAIQVIYKSKYSSGSMFHLISFPFSSCFSNEKDWIIFPNLMFFFKNPTKRKYLQILDRKEKKRKYFISWWGAWNWGFKTQCDCVYQKVIIGVIESDEERVSLPPSFYSMLHAWNIRLYKK